MRRFWLNHAQVRSMTQRLCRTSKPRRGSNLCQSIFRSSLAHSSAQLRDLLGRGLGRTVYDLDAEAAHPSCSILVPALVTGIRPKVRKAQEAIACGLQQEL